MKLNLKLDQRLFLCAAPLVAGSVLAALPGSAATLAGSWADFTLSNFSHNPTSTSTFTTTNTLTIANIGNPETSQELTEAGSSEIIPSAVQSIATANAVATFPVAPWPELTQASNMTYSLAQGDAEGTGVSYLGVAQSTAQFVGYNFNVGAGETFSFDVAGALGLYTSRDNVSAESANSFSNISFLLYDNADLSNPINFVTFSAQLDSSGKNVLSFAKSEDLNFQPKKTAFNTSFGDKAQSVVGLIQGTFSKVFNELTSLTLVGFESNGAAVACEAKW